jgi:hypothetical protein
VELLEKVKMRNEYNNLARKPQGNISLVRLKHRQMGLGK